MRDRGDDQHLVVNELYVSLQGEGTRAGLPCTFVRLTGCGLRCSWCDSEYAFEEGTRRPLDEVVQEVEQAGTRLVLLTGGEPLEQPACAELASRLCDLGHQVLVETGGHVDWTGLDPRVVRIVDVKCPGSGMAKKNRLSDLRHLRPEDEVKFVITDRADFEFARKTIREQGLADIGCPLLLSPAHGTIALADLAAWVLELALPQARLNLQLHKLVWPDKDRGV